MKKGLLKTKSALLKRKLRKVSLFITVLLCALCVPGEVAFASSPEIVYDGKSQKVTFEHVNQTDLFENMKNMMPGDERSQKIILRAKNIHRETSFYLRAQCDEQTKEVLKDLTMDLYCNGKLLMENCFVFEDVKLGRVTQKDELELEAVLNVPLSLGNEAAGQTYQIDWYFVAQEDGEEVIEAEFPEAGQSTGTVLTGDSLAEDVIDVVCLLLVSGCLFLYFYRRRYKKG